MRVKGVKEGEGEEGPGNRRRGEKEEKYTCTRKSSGSTGEEVEDRVHVEKRLKAICAFMLLSRIYTGSNTCQSFYSAT